MSGGERTVQVRGNCRLLKGQGATVGVAGVTAELHPSAQRSPQSAGEVAVTAIGFYDQTMLPLIAAPGGKGRWPGDGPTGGGGGGGGYSGGGGGGAAHVVDEGHCRSGGGGGGSSLATGATATCAAAPTARPPNPGARWALCRS
jgi:hypothetical protein